MLQKKGHLPESLHMELICVIFHSAGPHCVMASANQQRLWPRALKTVLYFP